MILLYFIKIVTILIFFLQRIQIFSPKKVLTKYWHD